MGAKTCAAWIVPHSEHRTLLPTGRIPCTSPETFVGLCLNSLQMQKAQLGVLTHRDKEQLLAAAPAWPPFTPLFLLRQPTSLLFLLSSFPRFCPAFPGIPCFARQPALPHSSPSLLLCHHFFGICCSHGSKNQNEEIPGLGPSPFYSLWCLYSASRRLYQAEGDSIHACTSPQLGAFYSITAIKKLPIQVLCLKRFPSWLQQAQIYWWEQLQEE